MIFIARVNKPKNKNPPWLLCAVVVVCFSYIVTYAMNVHNTVSVGITQPVTTSAIATVNKAVTKNSEKESFSSFYSANNDFVGWLTIGDNMSFPVVQGSDNDYYLTHNCKNEKDSNGAVFLDYRNSIAPEYINGRNFQVYGHNKMNGTNFSNLKKQYSSVDGWKKCPVISFNTLYDNYNFVVVGAFITNAYGQDDVDNYVFPYSIVDITGVEDKYNSELQQRFLYSTGYTIAENDTLITLTTCSYDFTSARFIVVAKLIDNVSVDTSKAKKNVSPRYPQGWYTKRGLTNPYKTLEQWKYDTN